MEKVEDNLFRNPADRPWVTFDNNILIAMRKNEPAALPAYQLLALNRAGVITVNVTLSSALEEQRPNEELKMHEYAAWLQEQGIDHANIFTHPRTIGFHVPDTTPDTVTFSIDLELDLNMRIHQILFPNIPFFWFEYLAQEAARHGMAATKQKALMELDASFRMYIPPSPHAPMKRPTPTFDMLEQTEQEELRDLRKQLLRKWRNAKNDALGLYNHLTQAVNTTYPEQAVFVTNDRNFRTQTRLAALRACHFRGEILPPEKAITFLLRVTGTTLPQTEVEKTDPSRLETIPAKMET
jgi:hypothetical protein